MIRQQQLLPVVASILSQGWRLTLDAHCCHRRRHQAVLPLPCVAQTCPIFPSGLPPLVSVDPVSEGSFRPSHENNCCQIGPGMTVMSCPRLDGHLEVSNIKSRLLLHSGLQEYFKVKTQLQLWIFLYDLFYIFCSQLDPWHDSRFKIQIYISRHIETLEGL